MGLFECWLHFFIVGSIVIYTVLLLCFYSIFSGKKKAVDKKVTNKFVKWLKSLSNANIAFVANACFHFIAWIIFVIIPHCWLCTILLIVYFVWLLISIVIYFFGERIINALLKKLKKGEKSKMKTKWITKLTNWKNEIEFEKSAVTLNDAFNIAPVLNSKDSFDLSKLNKAVEKFGDCEVKHDENIGGNNMIHDCWIYNATIKGKKDKIIRDSFAYLFDLRKNNGKDKAAILLLKIEPRDRKELFRFYPNAAVSKFPLGRDYIAFPMTNTVSFDSCEIYLRKAYDFSKRTLEEEEFDKMSKKIKM